MDGAEANELKISSEPLGPFAEGDGSSIIRKKVFLSYSGTSPCGHPAYVDTMLLRTLFVWPSGVHISEVLLYLHVFCRSAAESSTYTCIVVNSYMLLFVLSFVH